MNQLTRPRLVAHSLRDPLAAICAQLEDLPPHYCAAALRTLRTATSADEPQIVADWAEEAAKHRETLLRGCADAAALRLMASLLRDAAPIIEANRKELSHGMA